MSFALNGLASGLDTGKIISELMQLERIPYQKLEHKKDTINSEISVFRSINTKLSALRTASNDLLLSSSFNIKSATSSNESVLKATVSETVEETSYNIHVEKLATQHSVKSKQFTPEELEMSVEAGDLAITINGETFENTEAATLQEALDDIMGQINASDHKVRAIWVNSGNNGGKTLVMNAQEYGMNGSIDYSADSSIDLGLSDAIPAQDAILTINGVQITSSSNQLNDVLPGMSLSLQQTGDTTINVTKDVDKITEKVEAFVNAYNDVINTIRSNTAKEKVLQGDSTLRSLEGQLNGLFNSSHISRLEGEDSETKVTKYLYDIGLEIDKGITSGSMMTGTISFDKEKFQAALAENPDDVFNLFAKNDEDNNEVGIARVFSDKLMEWTRVGTGIITLKIDGYNDEISDISKRMDDMNVRLEMKEAQLQRQFTAMETALIQLQNQQSWLASQIASLGTSYY